MAPSSLMKMSGGPVRSEGNYASFEEMSRAEFTSCDSGLTLLPGSQIHKRYEKEARTAAEGSPEELGSKYAGRGDQWMSFEAEIQSKTRAQEAGLSNEVTNPSSFPESGLERAKMSLGTARVNQEEPNSQSTKYCSAKMQGAVKSVVVAPLDEQVMGTIEIRNTESCQCDDYFPRAAKRRRSGGRESIERQNLRISKGKQAPPRAHGDRFHVRHQQNLSGVNAIHAENGETLVAIVDVPFSGAAGDWGPRNQQPRTQVTGNSKIVVAHDHQSTILGFKELALRGDTSMMVDATSRPSRKEQHSELEEPTVHYQSSIFSKSLSAQYRKHPCLFLKIPTKIRKQMLKPINEVNRSWTSHFPAKAKILRNLRSANLPAPFLRVPRLTPREDRHEPHQNTIPLTSTNLYNYTHSSSTHPSPPLSTHLRLAEAFNHSSDAGDLAHIFDTAHTRRFHQSSRRRSDSLPELAFTYVPLDMHSSNNFGPSSIPTPPREQPSCPRTFSSSNLLTNSETPPFCQNLVGSSRGRADASFNIDDSVPLFGQYNSNLQREHEINLSGSPSLTFASGPQSRQIVAQQSEHNNMAGPPAPTDLAVTSGEPILRRRTLEVKPNYSYEEVKSLVSSLMRETKALKAENTNLQSMNTAMAKVSESFQQCQASLNQTIQHHEQTIAQKDQQIEAMRHRGSSLEHNYRTVFNDYKRLDNDHQQLIANIRKANGADKPSEIAKRIRLDHSPNAVGTPGQSGQPREKPLLPDSFQRVPSIQPSVAAVENLVNNEQTRERFTEQLLTNPVTIDLTDDSGPSSTPMSQDSTTRQSTQSHMPPSPPMPDQESQGDDSGPSQIGKGTRARTAQERCSWLPEGNPYKGIEAQARLSNSRLSLTGGANGKTHCPERGRVAPLPETATGRRTKEAPKKAKVLLGPEAKKERQKAYRKTAAEKKERENAMRGFKQERRAAKAKERQNRARKHSEESGPLKPRTTLDGRLYEESTHNGNEAGQEQDETAALAAELEAELEAMLDEESKTDANLEEMEGVESIDAASEQTPFPSTPPDGDDGYHDLFSESEEE